MQKLLVKSLSISALIATSSFAFGQSSHPSNGNPHSKISIPVKDGSIFMNLKKYGFGQKEAVQNLNAWLNLSDDFSFKEISRKSDELNFTHVSFIPYYKGIEINGNMVILHFKDDQLISINGKISRVLDNTNIYPQLKEEAALENAKNYLQVPNLMNVYPAELVIRSFDESEGSLAWKVRIDGFSAKTRKMQMANVFVDAVTGKVLKTISLLTHADVDASAKTLYNGTQTMTTDEFSGGYRLRDNGRIIETYDVGGLEPNGGMDLFLNPKDYVNQSTNWDEMPTLMSFSLNNTSSSMTSGLGFTSNSYTFLASFFGIGDFLNFDDIEIINQNLPLEIEGPNDLPFIQEGLYIPIDINNSYVSGFAKMSINQFNQVDMTDSFFFELPDLTLGSHPWTEGLENDGNYVISEEHNPALDAHWGMGKTYDYFETTFARSSFDNQGSTVKNYVNGMMVLSGTNANAAAMPAPYNSLVYGMGDGINMSPVVGLDVMGHEFTHLVTEHNGNGGLEYQGESGALNESFSDMFGTCIEFFTDNATANWTIGEDISIESPYFRSMSDPKSLAAMNNPYFPPQPDTYLGQYWMNTSSNVDNGGVHINSGVPNKWFYLLTEGGNGINDNSDEYIVTGIGMEKSSSIIYRTLVNYLTPTSEFIDAYNATLQAAEDLYGLTSDEYKSVGDAWFAVGLGEHASDINDLNLIKNEIEIYPNPVTSEFVIHNHSSEKLQAQLINIAGSTVMDMNVKQGINKVNVSSLSKGIYFVKMNLGAASFTHKLVIQ